MVCSCAAKVISELSAIVEHGMEIQLNKESFSYSRFCMHLRYLVQRMMHGNPLNADNAMDSMFVTMRNEYPQVYACVQQIDTFLHGTYGWQCSKEEQLYLIMHPPAALPTADTAVSPWQWPDFLPPDPARAS